MAGRRGARRADSIRTRARYLLAAVRLANGGAALVAPRWFGRQAGLDLERDPAAVHVVRMFGVRTTLLAGDLLLRRGASLRGALAVAPLIHAADLASALASGAAGELPRRSARTAAGLSALNLASALVAGSDRR